MSEISISVIVPVYNTAKYFREAVESILSQTYQPLEVLVIDDGSTDNFREVVKPYLDDIVIIYKNMNEGLSAAYNTGVSLARGSWIAFCDGDDYWHPEKLEKQVAKITNETDFVFCDKYIFSDRSDLISRRYPVGLSDQPLFSMLKSFFASPSTVLIRKSALEACGTFPTSFPSSEDYQLFIKLAAYSPNGFMHVPELLTYKRVRSTSIQGSQDVKELLHYLLLALDDNKQIFMENLSISERAYQCYIGYNLGFFARSFGLYLHCAYLSFRRGLMPFYYFLRRLRVFTPGSSWYSGGLDVD